MLTEMWRKGNPSALLVGMQTGAATMGNSVESPQKTRNGIALWPSNLTSGSLSKETWNTNLKEHTHPCVHCSVIYNTKDVEAAQVSISRLVDRTTRVHSYNGILLGCKRQGNQTAWMDLENIMLNEVASQRKTNTMRFHWYVESHEQTQLTSKIETDLKIAGWQLWEAVWR